MNSRCDECMQWTKEEMEKYVKLRKSLSSKSKRCKSSPPRSIPQDCDADDIMATQLDSVQKLVDDRIEAMSVQLMARFSSMLDKFQSRDSNISCSDSSAVLGHSATKSEPVSRRPTDRIKCPTGLRFRKGREDPAPQEDISTCDSIINETPETPRDPPADAGEPQGRRSAPAFVRHHQAGAGFESQPDDDDRDSGADSAPSDKTYLRLMRYVHDRFPHSEPASAPREPPRCEFEEFFLISEASSSAKPILTLYPRVDEILDSCADRAARFAKESKPLYCMLPFERKATPVGDRLDFYVSRYVN